MRDQDRATHQANVHNLVTQAFKLQRQETLQKVKGEKDKGKDKKKKKGKEGSFEQPIGLSVLFDIFGGVQMNIRRIHIRYEDDFFSIERPFSLGLCIDEIELCNRSSHWAFKTPTGMQFSRQKNE